MSSMVDEQAGLGLPAGKYHPILAVGFPRSARRDSYFRGLLRTAHPKQPTPIPNMARTPGSGTAVIVASTVL